MRIYRLIFIFIIAILFYCTNKSIKENNDTENWQSLIKNNSFQQWEAIGEDIWVIDQDTITATPKKTSAFLKTIESYDNFHLKLEFWVNDNTNSGVFFRCSSASEINPINCYEANIWDNHPNQSFRTGALVTRVESSIHVNTLNQWNSYEIIANNSDITLKVNGKITAKLQDDSLTSGPLALQYAGKGIVKFRKIYIKEL